MRIVVIVEGGLVQYTLADGDAELLIVDYDVDGTDQGLVEVPQGDGSTRQANVYRDDPALASSSVAALYACCAPVVLVIPDPEGDQGAPPYGVAPGSYTMQGVVDLLRLHKAHPGAIQYIADMLEE